MKNIVYGLLSTSSIAPRFLAAVRAVDGGEVLALSSRSLEKAQDLAQQWQIPVAYGSHEELLADERINTVYISTINSLHYHWAVRALEMGKNVICEKPCTTTPEDTRALFALAQEKGLFLMEAEKMLFLPALLEVRRQIQEGNLGQIHMVQLSHSFPASYNNWMFDEKSGAARCCPAASMRCSLSIGCSGKLPKSGGRGVFWIPG